MNRAQSDTIGVLLLTLIIVVSVTTVGVFAFQEQQRRFDAQPPQVDLTVEMNDSTAKVVHTGGESLPLAELRLVLRAGGEERTYNLSAPAERNATSLDGDGDFEFGEWVLVDHSLTGDVRIFVVTTSQPGHVLYDETEFVESTRPRQEPTIERFEIADNSANGDASFEATWNASDRQGDITGVTVELVQEGVVEDSATTSFGGVAATGLQTDVLTNASGGGLVYQIKLTVTDAAGHTVTESIGDTADSDIGLRDPTLQRFDVTDTTTGQDASYDVTYNATDPDGDIVEVRITLIDEDAGTVVDNVTDTYSQTGATGVQTRSLSDPVGKEKGTTYRINITVVDLKGNEIDATTTDVADSKGGGGGAGNAPVVERFDVTDTTSTAQQGKADASFEVTWRASDADGDLANATLRLLNKNGNPRQTITYTSADFTSRSDTGTITATLTDKNGAGKEYVIELVVTDQAGNTLSESESHLADGDDTSSSSAPP